MYFLQQICYLDYSDIAKPILLLLNVFFFISELNPVAYLRAGSESTQNFTRRYTVNVMGAISLFQLSFQPSGAILYILVSLSMKKCSLSTTKRCKFCNYSIIYEDCFQFYQERIICLMFYQERFICLMFYQERIICLRYYQERIIC